VLGMPAGVVLGAGALLTYLLMFGGRAKTRRSELAKERARHKTAVARIRLEHKRL